MNQRWRDLIAFSVAPAVTALVVALVIGPNDFGAVLGIGLVAAAVTYGHALIFGVPAYLWLRHRRRLRPVVILPISFAMGAIPVLILTYIGAHADYAALGADVLVDGGQFTTAGHIANARTSAIFGLIGAATGLLWLLIAGYWRSR